MQITLSKQTQELLSRLTLSGYSADDIVDAAVVTLVRQIEAAELPQDFLDPKTGEKYGIEALLQKLQEAEADVDAERLGPIDLEQKLEEARQRHLNRQAVNS